MKGLSFSEPMIKAWMDGRKTVTRRLMNPQPLERSEYGGMNMYGQAIFYPPDDLEDTDDSCLRKPKYFPGETVYIKETWAQIWNQDGCIKPEWERCLCPCEGCHIEYKADTGAKYPGDWPDDSTGDPSCPKWKSPRFMPEWAARSHASIVSVKPERIQEISYQDALNEGIDVWIKTLKDPSSELREQRLSIKQLAFSRLWDSLHPGSWDRNDWVWRIELEKLP